MSSTSVYKPLGLPLLSRTPEFSTTFNQNEIRKVKRVLFTPVDHDATQKFIDEELSKIKIIESERWNFDFVQEKTLKPNGIFEWRPATPSKCLRPIKRRPQEEVDISEFYPEPLDPVVDIIRPKPIKLSPQQPRVQQKSYQCRITDFMKATKRSASELTKKYEWNTERPSKMSRIADPQS